MASPQLENGYVKLANELLDALIFLRLPGQELRVVLAVMRKTYGFNKKSDIISYGQISKMTDIPRPKVIRHIKSLVSKRVLGSSHNGTRQPLTFWINKNYDEWRPGPLKGTSPQEGTTSSPQEGTTPSPHQGTHKIQYTKDNINTEEKRPEKISREISSGPSPETRDDYLCQFENSNVRELVERVIEKLPLTRKSGRISESIVLRTLKALVSFEDWKVGTGCSLYLDNEYYLDGKGESYFLGIVRHVTAKDYERVIGKRERSSSHDSVSREFHWKNARNVLKYDGEQRFLEYCRAHGLEPSEVPEWNTRNLPGQ